MSIQERTEAAAHDRRLHEAEIAMSASWPEQIEDLYRELPNNGCGPSPRTDQTTEETS